jgi:hypothetical protein
VITGRLERSRCVAVSISRLGDRSAREVTTREIEELLRSVATTGVAPRTVNKVRQLICAIFNYGTRRSTYGLPINPASHADRRAEPERTVLFLFFARPAPDECRPPLPGNR